MSLPVYWFTTESSKLISLTDFPGEISAPFPTNYKIPHKLPTTNNEPVSQINPMEYYATEPIIEDETSSAPKAPVAKEAKKRKLEDGAPHLFYSSESLHARSRWL